MTFAQMKECQFTGMSIMELMQLIAALNLDLFSQQQWMNSHQLLHNGWLCRLLIIINLCSRFDPHPVDILVWRSRYTDTGRVNRVSEKHNIVGFLLLYNIHIYEINIYERQYRM
jgi:hypothetical protein